MNNSINSAVQDAVAARLGIQSTQEELPDLAEGVQAVPDYSEKNTKAELEEIARQMGMELTPNMTKKEMVEAMDHHIEECPATNEEMEPVPADLEETPEENEQPSIDPPDQENGALDTVLVIYDGYVNIRSEPARGDNVIEMVWRGTRMEVTEKVSTPAGDWYALKVGGYITADPELVELEHNKTGVFGD